MAGGAHGRPELASATSIYSTGPLPSHPTTAEGTGVRGLLQATPRGLVRDALKTSSMMDSKTCRNCFQWDLPTP